MINIYPYDFQFDMFHRGFILKHHRERKQEKLKLVFRIDML